LRVGDGIGDEAGAGDESVVGERAHVRQGGDASDVGKLNRLVIPKQYAEKHFPLDASSNEKGLLLSFEDSAGKQWRFCYSYWNSSQSYVVTKGWSHFVKDKKLDAGNFSPGPRLLPSAPTPGRRLRFRARAAAAPSSQGHCQAAEALRGQYVSTAAEPGALGADSAISSMYALYDLYYLFFLVQQINDHPMVIQARQFPVRIGRSGW